MRASLASGKLATAPRLAPERQEGQWILEHTIVNNREYIPIEAFLLLILFYYGFGVIFVRIAAVFGREIKY